MKRLVKRIGRWFGVELRRHDIYSSAFVQLNVLFAKHRVSTVLDVGANVGQFGRGLRDVGYRGRIVSFEPVADAHAQLLAESKGDPDWIVAPRLALGDREAVIDVNLSENSVSSSVLAVLPEHLRVAPGSRYVRKEQVRLARLDDVAPAFVTERSVVFLKIDAQGYEHQVLAGASALLDRVAGVQVESSLVPLYEGQGALLPGLMQQFLKRDFSLWAILPVLIDPRSGRLLQADVIFFRQP